MPTALAQPSQWKIRALKQHLVPALKTWKAANQGTAIVDTSLAYDMWGNYEYTLAFGNNLATRLIAHNNVPGQPVAPGTASGANSGNDAVVPINNTVTTSVTNTTAASTTTGGGKISFSPKCGVHDHVIGARISGVVSK